MLLSICLLQINHVCPNLHTPVQLFAFNMRVHVFMCLFACVCELKHFHLFSFLFFAIAPELDSFSHLRFIESSVAVLTRRNHNKRNCFYLWPRKKIFFHFFKSIWLKIRFARLIFQHAQTWKKWSVCIWKQSKREKEARSVYRTEKQKLLKQIASIMQTR